MLKRWNWMIRNITVYLSPGTYPGRSGMEYVPILDVHFATTRFRRALFFSARQRTRFRFAISQHSRQTQKSSTHCTKAYAHAAACTGSA